MKRPDSIQDGILNRKWRIAAGLAFMMALASDLAAKHFACAAMTTLAGRAAGFHPNTDPQSQVSRSEITLFFGLTVALIAAVCWGISASRREPGSSVPVVILALLYGLSLSITV